MPKHNLTNVANVYTNLYTQIFASLGYDIYSNPNDRSRLYVQHIPYSVVRKAARLFMESKKLYEKELLNIHLRNIRINSYVPKDSNHSYEVKHSRKQPESHNNNGRYQIATA